MNREWPGGFVRIKGLAVVAIVLSLISCTAERGAIDDSVLTEAPTQAALAEAKTLAAQTERDILIKFFTDVFGISPAAAGTLFLVARIATTADETTPAPESEAWFTAFSRTAEGAVSGSLKSINASSSPRRASPLSDPTPRAS